MHDLIKEYIKTTKKPKLSDFVSLNKKAIVLYCFNSNVVEWEDIRAEISKCCSEIKKLNQVCSAACSIFKCMLILFDLI